MELLEYQRSTQKTWQEIADETGVPKSNLHALAHGKRDCSMETQRQIEDGTEGAVTANDIQRARRRYLAEIARDAVAPAHVGGA